MNRVVLVGAGCGAGTLTLRGAQLLRRCDCVVYDSLLDEGLLSLVRQDCEKIFVGKRAGAHAVPQEEINCILVRCAARYSLTVRLKGGDPFVFGRGGEELAALAAANVRCSVVPGVTSAVAAAEYAGIPITHRGVAQSFCVVTAYAASGEVRIPDPQDGQTLVFLMAKSRAAAVAQALMEKGMTADMPAALLSAAGTPSARTVRCRLGEVAARVQSLPAPLTFVVGRVCAEDLLGGSLSRCMSAPRVVVTGTSAHVQKVCAALDARGFTAIPCAVLRIEPLAFDFFFEQIGSFDLLAFTSPNGVEIFFSRARALGTDWRVFGGKTFAALGTETAASLREYGFRADILPADHTAEGLAAALAGRDAARTALLRAQNGNPILCSAGVQISLYRTEADAEAVRRAAEALGAARFVTFGSAKGARALLDACSLPETVTPVCIGAETAKVLKERGYRPAVAQAHAAEALAEAVVREEEICND